MVYEDRMHEVYGGFIESEDSLSHEGDCLGLWDAEVYGNAKVYGNARSLAMRRSLGTQWSLGMQ
jgi:hypothetical protein